MRGGVFLRRQRGLRPADGLAALGARGLTAGGSIRIPASFLSAAWVRFSSFTWTDGYPSVTRRHAFFLYGVPLVHIRAAGAHVRRRGGGGPLMQDVSPARIRAIPLFASRRRRRTKKHRADTSVGPNRVQVASKSPPPPTQLNNQTRKNGGVKAPNNVLANNPPHHKPTNTHVGGWGPRLR